LRAEGKSPFDKGIAVEEDCALIVENGVGTVSTKDDLSKIHGAYLHDFSESRYNVDGYRFHNIKTGYLTEGDSIDLNTFEITIRSDKTNIAG